MLAVDPQTVMHPGMNEENESEHIEDSGYYSIDADDRRNNEIAIFVRDAKPNEWRSLANELRDAAEVLWQDKGNGLRAEINQWTEIVDGKLVTRKETRELYSISRPFVLLAGFAIENMLKAFLVESDPSLILAGELHPTLKSHDLEQLITRLPELELSKEELEFCRIATSAIPYWGRYPIPTAFNRVVPEIGMTQEYYQVFNHLFDRLDSMLYDRIRDGWERGTDHESLPMFDARYDPQERLNKVRIPER